MAKVGIITKRIIGESVQERILFFISFILLLIVCGVMIRGIWIRSLIILLYLSLMSVLHINTSLKEEQRKLSEAYDQMREEEEIFRIVFEQSPVGLSLNSNEVVEYNAMYARIVGRTEEEIRAAGWKNYTHPEDIGEELALYERFKSGEMNRYNMEKRFVKPGGDIVWANVTVASLNRNRELDTNYLCIVEDITDRKKKEEEILYLNDHDHMTGVYNRRFLESAIERTDKEHFLPLSVLVGDINGVKLINDAFGHATGDILIMETARIIQSCCRNNDILARTGGDEFVILMPRTGHEAASGVVEEIRRKCEEYNRDVFNEAYAINISLGYATKEKVEEDLGKIKKLAEDFMYKRKLLEHKSSHSVILSSIKATMYEKSHETQEHAERITYLSKELGKRLDLSQNELDELELVATLHDIGKVGIDDRILNKEGKLSEEEWIEMKKHSEIGYRIAMSSPDLVPIAEHILCHHERWDGKGYPQGIRGEEIPQLSRIVTIIDAFDAMTEDRPYRKCMTAEEAAEEIRSNAGTQFDPRLAKLFLEKIFPYYEKEKAE